MSHKHFYPDNSIPTASILTPRLLYTGTVGDDPEWFNIPHKHDFCELLYVVGGRGWAQVGDQRCELGEGKLVVFNAGVLHEEHSDAGSPLAFAFCGLDSFRVEGRPPSCLLPADTYPVLDAGDCRRRLEQTFADLIHETSEQISYCTEMSNSLVSTLLVLVLRLLLTQDKQLPTATMSEECRRVTEFINSNYYEPLSLANLSQTVYISKHHLAHMFKSQTGISPIRYLINRRISEAQRLLRDTELSISEVATQVGYTDPVYFSQIFKKSTGISPSAYRGKSPV